MTALLHVVAQAQGVRALTSCLNPHAHSKCSLPAAPCLPLLQLGYAVAVAVLLGAWPTPGAGGAAERIWHIWHAWAVLHCCCAACLAPSLVAWLQLPFGAHGAAHR